MQLDKKTLYYDPKQGADNFIMNGEKTWLFYEGGTQLCSEPEL